LTPDDCIHYDIHLLLIQAPRKLREKYGKRKEISEFDRTYTCRERNREHAKATRVRKRIFREVKISIMRMIMIIICYKYILCISPLFMYEYITQVEGILVEKGVIPASQVHHLK
jgi:hypothetical protein